MLGFPGWIPGIRAKLSAQTAGFRHVSCFVRLLHNANLQSKASSKLKVTKIRGLNIEPKWQGSYPRNGPPIHRNSQFRLTLHFKILTSNGLQALAKTCQSDSAFIITPQLSPRSQVKVRCMPGVWCRHSHLPTITDRILFADVLITKGLLLGVYNRAADLLETLKWAFASMPLRIHNTDIYRVLRISILGIVTLWFLGRYLLFWVLGPLGIEPEPSVWGYRSIEGFYIPYRFG